MNAVTKLPAPTDDALIEVLRSSLYPEGSVESIRLVLGYCRAAGFDPMKKPVHIVPMWNKRAGAMVDTIMPGIGLYRIEAARTGEYIGKTEPEFGPDITRKLGNVEVTFPSWCRITVQRLLHGRVCEYTAKEYWVENYATAKKDTEAPNAMWRKRPYGQLAKCTESQALRMAFPEQVGGTNTAEEMEGKTFEGVTLDASPEPAPQQARKPAPQIEQDRPDPNASPFIVKLREQLDRCHSLEHVATVEGMGFVQAAFSKPNAPADLIAYAKGLIASACENIERNPPAEPEPSPPATDDWGRMPD